MKEKKVKETLKRFAQVGFGAGTVLLSAYYISKASERQSLSERLRRIEELVEKIEKIKEPMGKKKKGELSQE